MFEIEFIWMSFEKHFQEYNWLAEAKHLQDNFSDFSDFYRNFFRTDNF
jgi:hypothetical protein